MSALLACTGGAILVVQAAEMAGLPRAELISWFAAVYIIGEHLIYFWHFDIKCHSLEPTP